MASEYDPATDYAIPEKFRPFRPTKDDPLCARCGWPKHHHFHGTGGLAYTATRDRCSAFAAPAPIIVVTDPAPVADPAPAVTDEPAREQ